MIIDIRHHLASLVAVFLALGLGMIIGASLSSDGRLVNEQAALIDAIDAQLTQLKTEKSRWEQQAQQAASETALYKEFLETLLPDLIGGMLATTPVGVVNMDNRIGSTIEQTITAAGGVLSYQAIGYPAEPGVVTTKARAGPGKLVVVAGANGPLEQTRRLVQELRQAGLRVVVAGAAEWARNLNIPGVSVVNRVDTAIGQLQLVKQLAAENAGEE